MVGINEFRKVFRFARFFCQDFLPRYFHLKFYLRRTSGNDLRFIWRRDQTSLDMTWLSQKSSPGSAPLYIYSPPASVVWTKNKSMTHLPIKERVVRRTDALMLLQLRAACALYTLIWFWAQTHPPTITSMSTVVSCFKCR